MQKTDERKSDPKIIQPRAECPFIVVTSYAIERPQYTPPCKDHDSTSPAMNEVLLARWRLVCGRVCRGGKDEGWTEPSTKEKQVVFNVTKTHVRVRMKDLIYLPNTPTPFAYPVSKLMQTPSDSLSVPASTTSTQSCGARASLALRTQDTCPRSTRLSLLGLHKQAFRGNFNLPNNAEKTTKHQTPQL